MAGASEPQVQYELARTRARGLLTLTRQKPPIDLQAIIDLAGIPVVERSLPDGTQATIGDTAGGRLEGKRSPSA